ncbi:MAG: glycosyl hydrolase family 18 protein [Bacteroidales bacterium]
MKRTLTTFVFLFLIGMMTHAQAPTPSLVGYWQNWSDPNAPYMPLSEVDSRYNMVNLSFAVPENGTDYKMTFTPDQGTPAALILQIQTLQALGTKVNISAGGGNSPISLDNIMERDTFITRMGSIINTYGFDGMDIDFEGSSLTVSGGTIAAPIDAPVINLIYALKQIMANYYVVHGKRLILTMAPETAFVQGGMAAYTGMWGAYLPVIQALRDSLEILHVQLYNSGGTYGINHVEYQQGTADFIVAMTEAAIHGFSTAGGTFDGLPASKVAVALPACPLAAGGGFVDTATVMAAMNFLLGKGPQPGTYTLVQAGGYPALRGMMTWSVNWDVVSTCATRYQYANNYQRIFAPPILVKSPNGGENLQRGAAYNITWDDAIPENVKIDLFDGAAMVLEISASIPSNGTYVWNIPAGLETGTDYKIRISSIVNGDISDLSNTDFNIEVNSAIEDPSPAQSLKLYPNPAFDVVTIETGLPETISRVSICNQFGQTVLTEVKLKSGKLDVGSLLPGIYILCAESGSRTYYAKLIKQ